MLTAHERIALTRTGFRFEPIGGRDFFAVWPHAATAWAYEWHGGQEPDDREDLDPIEVEEVRFAVYPDRAPAQQIHVCASSYDADDPMIHWVPVLDEDAEAARERLQAFVETLA